MQAPSRRTQGFDEVKIALEVLLVLFAEGDEPLTTAIAVPEEKNLLEISDNSSGDAVFEEKGTFDPFTVIWCCLETIK